MGMECIYIQNLELTYSVILSRIVFVTIFRIWFFIERLRFDKKPFWYSCLFLYSIVFWSQQIYSMLFTVDLYWRN